MRQIHKTKIFLTYSHETFLIRFYHNLFITKVTEVMRVYVYFLLITVKISRLMTFIGGIMQPGNDLKFVI
jgi:hypothetical protein